MIITFISRSCGNTILWAKVLITIWKKFDLNEKPGQSCWWLSLTSDSNSFITLVNAFLDKLLISRCLWGLPGLRSKYPGTGTNHGSNEAQPDAPPQCSAVLTAWPQSLTLGKFSRLDEKIKSDCSDLHFLSLKATNKFCFQHWWRCNYYIGSLFLLLCTNVYLRFYWTLTIHQTGLFH